MSRLQAIENALSSINEAVFQELCDSFLAIRNKNYTAFSRSGSQIGKQKTIKGTPDTFLLLPNGKYILVEYSTNISSGVTKLESDILKCIDSKKTGILPNQISEIIICVNFNLKTNEVQILKQILANTRIALTIYTLSSLAIELHLHHRDLTNLYLGIPLDTGQIVSIDTFIKEYDGFSKGIATPLDNIFLHRESEIKELEQTISNNDFVILTGAAGVGKTKLSLEGIKIFLKENPSYTSYCISYKHHALLNDLYQYFDLDKDYILFIDDANRIDVFLQIKGFYKIHRKGKFKIVITVRDYAFQEIYSLCQEFSPKRIDLSKLSDQQIIDIISADSFKIRHPDYQNEIVRIADGNPRLAIMAALLCNAEKNIYVLNDVSDLFEKYFSTFILDDGEFAKELNIKCLGLIAFFYTIPFKDKETTQSILNDFNIKYSEFIDVIDKLDELELVEIQFDYVKIPEQNLSTYFFYKAFIKDNLLSFEVLLKNYFDSNISRFKDCVIPANNTFGYNNVMGKLKPELQKYWKTASKDEDSAYKFLTTFWYYLESETLDFIYNKINELPIIEAINYTVTYNENDFLYDKDKTIELIGEFFKAPRNLKDALTLAFLYIEKKPAELPELIHKIKEDLIFDRDDEKIGFSRQLTLYEVLLDKLNTGNILSFNVFFELSKLFLSFLFRHTKGGRNHSFYWYEYFIPNTEPIQELRRKIWDTLDVNFEKYPDQSFELLQSYTGLTPISKDVMGFDIPLLINVIENHLNTHLFEHCKYVHTQIRWCRRNGVTHPSFALLSEKFTNPTYKMFLKLDWEMLGDKEMFEFDDFREYEKLKEQEIRNHFVLFSDSEIGYFLDTFIYLKQSTKNNWNYGTVLDIVIDENCQRDFKLGCQLIKKVIEKEVDFIPRFFLNNNLKSETKANEIWNIIQERAFKMRTQWELSFYNNLDESLINKAYAKAIAKTVNNISESIVIHFDSLKRFLIVEPKLFENILSKIVEKNTKGDVRLQVWMDFFGEYFDYLGDNITLIETAYLQQGKIQSHFDYQGKGLLKILNKDIKFLVVYIDYLYNNKRFGDIHNLRDLGFVWQIENIEKELNKIFEMFIEKEKFLGILDHFCNSFFKNIKPELKSRAVNFLLEYCRAYYFDIEKMNIIVDIVRHSMKDLFEEMLLLYLTLNQDKESFSKIYWRGNGTSGVGDVILADIEAADWKHILSIVEKSNVGIKLIPIKKHLNHKIESCLRHGDFERQNRFLKRY